MAINSNTSTADSMVPGAASPASPPRSPLLGRFGMFLLFVVALATALGRPLYQLALHVAGNDLHSHILLIPFVCAYIICVEWKRLPQRYGSSPMWAVAPAIIGFSALLSGWRVHDTNSISTNDYLALIAFAFFCLTIAGGFLILGRDWMRAAAFPMAFLIFIVPLPNAAADYLENASKVGSAEVANMLFVVTRTPVLRDATVFQLPGITVEVAQECSGIRSSLVLFITSILASHLFLRSRWRRLTLIGAVIPLGLLRNGFRILVIALLCVHFGPQMINSPIHRRGGPLFFTASLVPLFLLLWWLRRGEVRRARAIGAGTAPPSLPANATLG